MYALAGNIPFWSLVTQSTIVILFCGSRGAGGGCGRAARDTQLSARECRVRLERIPLHERGSESAPRHGRLQTARTDQEEQHRCPVCGTSFALKPQLLRHVVVHIHMPASGPQGGGGPSGAISGELLLYLSSTLLNAINLVYPTNPCRNLLDYNRSFTLQHDLK